MIGFLHLPVIHMASGPHVKYYSNKANASRKKNKNKINSTTNVKKLFPCVRDQKQLCNRVFNVSMSAQK